MIWGDEDDMAAAASKREASRLYGIGCYVVVLPRGDRQRCLGLQGRMQLPVKNMEIISPCGVRSEE